MSSKRRIPPQILENEAGARLEWLGLGEAANPEVVIMTDAQGLMMFRCVFEYMNELEKLRPDRQLDLRGYIEPAIDGMLVEARKRGESRLKNRIVKFVGSARTVSARRLLKLLEED